MTTVWVEGRSEPVSGDEAPARKLAISFRAGRGSGGDEKRDRASLPLLYSAGAMRAMVDERRQEKQLQHGAATAAQGAGAGRWIEPPFPLRDLTLLLYDAPDFFAICDRLAQDVAGDWDLVDAEAVGTGEVPLAGDLAVAPGTTGVPERGDVDRRAIADDVAVTQRQAAEKLLAPGFAVDVVDRPLTVTQLCRCVEMDKDALGQGIIEVGRDPNTGRPSHAGHLPARLMRIETGGRTWVQLNDQDQAVAFFREFGSDPNLPSSRINATEASRAQHQREGDLKNEVYVVKHHHPAELHYGVPPIIPALVAVKGNMHSEARNLRYFTNRAMPDFLIQLLADASALAADQEADLDGAGDLGKLEDQIEEHLTLVARGDDYKTGFLRIPRDQCELKFERLGTSISDAEFTEYQRLNRDLQLRMYGMLPHRVGIIETASLGTGTGETQEETYKRAQIEPRQRELEAFFDAVLDAHGLTAVRFKFREIDVADEEREIVMYATADSSGAMSVNEARTWLSRLVKDQDFPPFDEDENAGTPKALLEGGGAGGTPPGTPGAGQLFGQGTGAPRGVTVPTGGAPPASPPVTERQLALDPRYVALQRFIADRSASRLAAFRERRAAADAERMATRDALRGNGTRAEAPA